MNLHKEFRDVERRSSRRASWQGRAGRQGLTRLLTFSPRAWLKLACFLHAGDFEVGGFGISRDDDPLYVEDFVTVAQEVTAVSVAFEDAAVADYFEDCAARGLGPARFARIWCHTHPGSSPNPSLTDEATFHRVFGNCDWAVMFILSRTHRTYARLGFGTGPGAQVPLEVAVDWEAWPKEVFDAGQWGGKGGAFDGWVEECRRNVRPLPPQPGPAQGVLAEWEAEAWELEKVALDLPPGGAGFAWATACAQAKAQSSEVQTSVEPQGQEQCVAANPAQPPTVALRPAG